jgi:hypothetical protein
LRRWRRYRAAGRNQKKEMLDEFVTVTGIASTPRPEEIAEAGTC